MQNQSVYKAMKIRRVLVVICRVLLALAFIFSGFVKAVDPMGSAIKLGEYFSAMNLGFLSGTEMFFAIAQSTLEIVLGVALLLGVMLRITSTLTLLFMMFFTGLTLWIAMTNPVADCGCFGDAVKLSNWGTFIKNAAVLLPLSILVAASAWMTPRRKGYSRGIAWIALAALLSVWLSVYCLRHLPVIDFLPYKIGTNIPAALNGDKPQEETKLVYRNVTTGKEQQFLLSDTTWYDTTKWEYVDTIVSSDANARGFSASSFVILDNGNDVTLDLVGNNGVVFMLCITDPTALDGQCADALRRAVDYASSKGYKIVAVTPVVIGSESASFHASSCDVPYYNIDDVTLKSLLRAKNGLVVFKAGVITDKRNCRDIPKDGKFPNYAN